MQHTQLTDSGRQTVGLERHRQEKPRLLFIVTLYSEISLNWDCFELIKNYNVSEGKSVQSWQSPGGLSAGKVGMIPSIRWTVKSSTIVPALSRKGLSPQAD